MSPEAVTTERVYALLKAEIVGGRYPPRTEIVVASIARNHGVSISPIRDSAQRLVGEGLLELQHGGGFVIPDMTEQGLHDLYDWHGQLIGNALQKRRDGRIIGHDEIHEQLERATAQSLAMAAAAIFQRLAGQAKNAELARAVIAAGERLHAVRLKERRHIPKLPQELLAIHTLASTGTNAALGAAIRAYHRRRLRRVEKLVEVAGGTLDGDNRPQR